MRRLLVILTLAGLAAMAGAISASADAVYHSEHLALYAHEQYVLNGAAPNSSYQVVLMVFPTDTTCSSSSTSVDIPTATITTSAAGNGNAFHVFTPADAGGLHGLTVGGMWVVMSGSTVAYETSCTTIHLD